MSQGPSRAVMICAVVFLVAACAGDVGGPATSVDGVGAPTTTSTTALATPSTSPTSTSTTLAVGEFDPRRVGAYVFGPVRWGVVIDPIGSGNHLVHMVVEVRPAADSQVEVPEYQTAEISGRLVWDETVVDLCTLGDRHERVNKLEEVMWIGDIFSTSAWCVDWEPNFGAIQDAFDEFGLPEQGCVGFTVDGITHEICEPLYELPRTYNWRQQ